MTAIDIMPLFDVSGEIALRADAPTARLLLPADASREEWEEARRRGIGGSDVAALFGLAGKYSSPRHVFEEKHGRSTFRETEPAEIGREIEGFIARMFSKRTGLGIGMPPGTLQNIERPWMRANVDRYVLDHTGAVVAPLECKNRSAWQADEWEDGVPDAPALQAHWYMAVGGWDHAYVAALVGGNSFRWHRLERDEELIEELVDHCEGWYQKHIVEGFPPPADGLEATTALLARLWDVKEETVTQVDPGRASELRKQRAALKEEEKDLAERLRRVENEMRLVCGENEVAQAGGRPAWSNKRNGNFAEKRFREAMPELAADYMHQVEAVDLARLKSERPDIYNQFRARVLRVPAKGV